MPTEPVFLPLWPRPGVRETLEWLTDVVPYEDGGESRTELRTSARQTFEMSYFVPTATQPWVDNVLYGGRTLLFWVPLWPQVQHVGALAAGQMTIQAETRYSDFRDGGNVLIWHSASRYQIVEVNQVTGVDELTLSDATEEFADAYLIPLRTGRLTGNPPRQLNGRNSVLSTVFALEDNRPMETTEPAQYLGADLYTDPGLLEGGSVTEQVQARVDVFDPGLGLVTYRYPWLNNKLVRTHRMAGNDQADAWGIREFLYRRRGRSVPFWQPSFENDLRLVSTGALGAVITVRPDAYVDYASARVHVAVEQRDGTWHPREIIDATALGPDQLQLTLDATLGGFDASTVRRISFLGLKRLNADRVEITYPSWTLSDCAVPTLEIQP